MLLKIFTVLQLTFFILNGYGIADPKKNSRQDYIERYKKLAIKEMNESSIPASIILAQACLESGDGNSTLSRQSNNHFGIKCKNTWTGERVFHDDDEKGECFRKYSSPLESYRDHSKFLIEGSRYQFLFDYNIRDYKQWAYGLKKAGYATNPRYPELLIKIIEDYDLHDLDRYYKKSGSLARITEKRNRRKAFFATEGDTYENIAKEFSLSKRQIFSYNDCPKGSSLSENELVYVERKRGKAPRGNDTHVARENETMWSIAQWYGVRIKALYRKNKMNSGDEPAPGQTIRLR